jgi:hypothetical protein
MDLGKAHSGSNESVRSMTNTNPFSYTLLRPPPGGAVDINKSDVSEKLMLSRRSGRGGAARALEVSRQSREPVSHRSRVAAPEAAAKAGAAGH